MIDYLEQLQRDLVEAIDRARPRPRRRRRPRPRRGRDWTPVATATAALLVIAVTVALVARTASPPEVEQAQPRPAIPLRLTEDLTRIDATTQRARARGPGGVGTLTIGAGPPNVVRPCCRSLAARLQAPAGCRCLDQHPRLARRLHHQHDLPHRRRPPRVGRLRAHHLGDRRAAPIPRPGPAHRRRRPPPRCSSTHEPSTGHRRRPAPLFPVAPTSC